MQSQSVAPAVSASRGCFDVLGTRVDALDLEEATSQVEDYVRDGTKAYIVFCTASSVLAARDDASVRRAMDEARLVLPDGMPLVWLGRRSGHDVGRVYGPDLMVEMFRRGGGSLRHFFYGGAPGVAEEMARKMQRRYPGTIVAGTLTPPQGLSGRDLVMEHIACINEARPDVVWVGLGHPKQELWMHAHRPHLEAPVLAGVGAAFDFLSGRVAEAPRWMQDRGLQWLHRLSSDPRRLWRRYLVGNARFAALVASDAIRGGRSR